MGNITRGPRALRGHFEYAHFLVFRNFCVICVFFILHFYINFVIDDWYNQYTQKLIIYHSFLGEQVLSHHNEMVFSEMLKLTFKVGRNSTFPI